MINTNSETWNFIKKYLVERIEDNRRQLESVNCPADTAHVLRGCILEDRDLLELPEADQE